MKFLITKFIFEPPVGFEPTTGCLQNSYSTNWVMVANKMKYDVCSSYGFYTADSRFSSSLAVYAGVEPASLPWQGSILADERIDQISPPWDYGWVDFNGLAFLKTNTLVSYHMKL